MEVKCDWEARHVEGFSSKHEGWLVHSNVEPTWAACVRDTQTLTQKKEVIFLNTTKYDGTLR